MLKGRPRRVALLVAGVVLLFVCLGVALVACGPVKRPDGGVGLLPIGSAAPDLEGHDAQGKSVRLSERRGHVDVVYFYPKDETPGCTHEACAFRDAFDRYTARGITIFGVSRDSDASHEQFRHKNALPFPLVADEGGVVQRAYGVSGVLGMASRVTFLVGPDGKIARVWPDVDPGVHAAEVLAAAEALNPVAP
jgi:peroxiredoxin Q/BCP